MKKIAILFSLLISLVPLLFFSFFFFNEFKSLSEERVQQTIQRELDIGSQNLSDFLKERYGNLLEWSMSPAFQVAFEFGRPEGLKNHLKFLKVQYPVYDAIIVLTPSFKMFASSNEDLAILKKQMPIFDKPINNDPVFAILNGELFVASKIKSSNSGKLLGYLAAQITSAKFSMFNTQIVDHLAHYRFKSLAVKFRANSEIDDSEFDHHLGKISEKPENKVKLCSLTKEVLLKIGACAEVDREELLAGVTKIRWMITFITMLLILITFAVISGAFRKMLEPLYKILDSLSRASHGDYAQIRLNSSAKELQVIESKYNELIENLKIETEKSKEHSKNLALIEVSRQVSHDIRSPLAALNMIIGTLSQINEEQRVTLRHVSNRISDIANQLLNTQKRVVATEKNSQAKMMMEPEKKSVELLSAVIDMIVSEKRIQYREKHFIEIEARLEGSYGLFARIDAVELKRVISNLVNNSVEAMTSRHGKIIVSLQSRNNFCEISVSDNGKGIPKSVLDKLGHKGVSYGKELEHPQSGSGLGIYHAKQTVESFGGSFEIDSEEGIGTLVKMKFPRADAPNWFVEKIQIDAESIIVSLDDDISIHKIWNRRLEILKSNSPKLQQKTFTSGLDFKNWLTSPDFSNQADAVRPLFLMDFELINQTMTGLDLIEELGIAEQSILVTSRYEDTEIRKHCMNLGVKLLPKALAEFVPFEVNKSVLASPTSDHERARFDLCLIDDDQALIGAVWAMEAASRGLKIKSFATPQAFVAEADRIDRQTPIYVDVSLGNGVNGIDVAIELNKLGFTNLNLATGFDASALTVPGFVNSVVGKGFPL